MQKAAVMPPNSTTETFGLWRLETNTATKRTTESTIKVIEAICQTRRDAHLANGSLRVSLIHGSTKDGLLDSWLSGVQQ